MQKRTVSGFPSPGGRIHSAPLHLRLGNTADNGPQGDEIGGGVPGDQNVCCKTVSSV